MKKQHGLIISLKAPSMLLIFTLGFFLSNCGNNSRDGKQEKIFEQDSSRSMMDGNGMMHDDMMEGEGMMQDGMMSEEMRKAMMSSGMGPEMMEDMRMIRNMLMNHEQI